METNTLNPVGIKMPDEMQKDQTNKEQLIQQMLLEEKKRLEAEYGVENKKIDHFKRPFEKAFTKDQRGDTTILFGGLTWKHEKLIKGALEGIGYKTEYVSTADKKAFQLGKEYGNNGQCNPTYFTVGNLVQHLQGLEASGIPKQEIIDKYVFFTAGACGPCRFGMYEAEYRLALRNSGYDGFRVLLFQQTGGLSQQEAEAGLEMNLDFFLGIINALMLGDIINEIGYNIRPYEVNEGETNKVMDEVINIFYEKLKSKKYFDFNSRMGKILQKLPASEYLTKFIDQVLGDYYMEAVDKAKEKFNSIKVDRTRLKPIVKVTGEFWAQTTEGDGNFNMFPFLEREGAQVLVEPIATWIMYMLHQAKSVNDDEKGLNVYKDLDSKLSFKEKLGLAKAHKSNYTILTLAEKIFEREYNRYRKAFGEMPHELVDQKVLKELAHPFYHSRVEGGEGHLEVGKSIYYTVNELCHMVLSLKPFGCMPSTQSDGVQSAVSNHYKNMIFLPIETSGEGDVNAHSRVQMALGEAKAKAKAEFSDCLDKTGYSLEEIKAYVETHDELQRPFHHISHRKGVAGMGANFILDVAEMMKKEGIKSVMSVLSV
ncbi:MAG: activator of (R)-2-hydroxyglutaryl-CoA dehydratase [Ignavibacteria bacterium]|nr:activator of (R)-2-hydroxyglutaryl-CoA dehydratase [Ignavibacteria bacterium]MBK7446592.1 activator of (R)-2-hydroxyglutaryl-CoA dehydratase [Ignavibacteria bacterium]MBK9405678.1 activator of (R)-2-hydroxyglutaryl-CoA dehydratase [Ignavibacteria bacterium]MBL0106445.1 activator of (R)-2-hydroxyglutaryl-CoA dehydratase [Ignavibacteria bacterium]